MNRKIAVFLSVLVGAITIVVLVMTFKSDEPSEEESEPTIFVEEAEKVYEYENLDALYFLVEENTPAFKEKLESWISEEEIEATRVNVLTKIDEENEESRFYLQLDDEDDTIITVIYSFKDDEYTLKRFKGDFDKVAAYGGTSEEQRESDAAMEEEIYDDSYAPEDEGQDIGELIINDPSGYLEEIDAKRLEKELTSYLESVNERRRMFTIDDFYVGEDCFEMRILFDTPRLDEKNVYAFYDSTQDTYEFSIK